MSKYNLLWSQVGTQLKTPIQLNPLTVDSTSTSLILTGKGTPYYGEAHQQNFIRLLENFASTQPPSSPTVGQIWFNTAEDAMYVYDIQFKWKRVGGVYKTDAQGKIVNPMEGDLWWNTQNKTLSVYDGGNWKQLWPSLNVVAVAFVDEYNRLVDVYNSIAGSPYQKFGSSNTPAGGGPATYGSADLYNAAGTYEPQATVIVDPNANIPTTYDSTNTFDGIGTYEPGTGEGGQVVSYNYLNWAGYGQDPLPYATIQNMSNTKWTDLIAKFAALGRHQGTALTGLPSRGFILDETTSHGVVTALAEYTAFIALTSAIEINRWNVSASSLQQSTMVSYQRVQPYFYTSGHEVALTFTSIYHARAYFNTGGHFDISASFTPSQSTTFNTAWQSFIGSIGTIGFSAKGTSYTGAPTDTPGFYALAINGAYVTIYNAVSSVPGSIGAFYQVKARLEQVQVGGPVILRFVIVFSPEGMNSAGLGTFTPASDSAIGSTVSSVVGFKASATNLNSPEIQYPTAAQFGSFVA